MATLSSSSVSIFKIPTALNPKPHELLHHFKPNQAPNPKSSNKPTFTTRNANSSTVNPLPTVITPKHPLTSPISIHQHPSTGYAAALLDAAHSHHALESVSRDVRRLQSKLLRRDKGDSMLDLREVVKRGKFHKYLSKLVSMLVGKSRSDRGAVEMVTMVLAEFGRIYEELAMDGSDRVVVLVPPGAKMELHQIAKVAEKVQNISGAAEVTVRQLAHTRLTSSLAV